MNNYISFQEYNLIGFLKSYYDLQMEFLTPIFKCYNEDLYYMQNIDIVNFQDKACDFIKIIISNKELLIKCKGKTKFFDFNTKPIYAFTFDGKKVLYGDYNYICSILEENTFKLFKSKHLFYDILLFLKKYDAARNMVKIEDFFGDYLSKEQIQLCQNIKLDEISKIESYQINSDNCNDTKYERSGNTIDNLIYYWLCFKTPGGYNKEFIELVGKGFSNSYFSLKKHSTFYSYCDLTKSPFNNEIKETSDNYIILNNLAIMYSDEKRNNYKDAIECYKKALKIKPDNAIIYNNLALLLCNSNIGDFENAMYCLTKAIDLFEKGCYDKSISFFYILGNGSKKHSISNNHALSFILTSNSKFNDDYYYMALNLANKRYKCIRDEGFDVINYSQIFAEVQFNLACLLTNDYFKEYDKAKIHFLKAIELSPDFDEVYYRLGRLYADIFEDYINAKSYLLKAIALNPKNYDAYRIISEICSYLGDEKYSLLYKEQFKQLSKRENDMETAFINRDEDS